MSRVTLLGILGTALIAACGEAAPSGSDATSIDASVETIVDTAVEVTADAGVEEEVDAVAEIVEDVPADVPSSYGQPCSVNEDCPSGWCVPSQEGNICTDRCKDDEDCPDGTTCKPTVSGAQETVFLCLPPILNHCGTCSESFQCDDGACVTLDGEGRCVFPCQTDDDCPVAYACGAVPGDQLPGTHCIPTTNSCSCNAYIRGGIRSCKEENDVGLCFGIQVCESELGWTECNAEVPATETCDGADNDCNGLIDDELPVGEPCENTIEDVGSCSGVTACSGSGGIICQAKVPALELCDGQDNDCDGTVDEDFTDADGNWTLSDNCGYCGNACEAKIINGTGTCGGPADAPVCVVDTCNEGFIQINDFQCVPPIEITCSACATDDNCLGGRCVSYDGQQVCMPDCNLNEDTCPENSTCTDVDGVSLCLPDSGTCSCTQALDGKTRACSITNDQGTCQGVETCDASQGWVGCTAATASVEICDGEDNDCDGVIDDDVGVNTCFSFVSGVGTCSGPELCKGLDGFECQAPTPELETCDYQDNDCDGTVDEDFRDAAGEYRDDENCGICGLTCLDKVLNGVGRCGGPAGTPSCEVAECDPGFYQAGPLACLPVTDDLCSPCVGDDSCPTPGDVCMQLEGGGFCGRDCSAGNLHGTAEDECPSGFSCVPDQNGGKQCVPDSNSCSCLPQDAGNLRPCSFSTATGACIGEETCDPAQGWVGCTAQPTTEICNFEDDDCDGDIDEGFTGLFEPCTEGIGLCQEFGLTTCSADGAAVVCSVSGADKVDEICDGLDNDCDGDTDEDFTNLLESCSAGDGICERFGFLECSADGSGTSCSAVAAPAEDEVCDGLDNNCDGTTDEGFANLGTPCTVGSGPCKNTGIWQCNALGTGVECSATGGTGAPELCDNIDNDCDGLTDEDFATKDTVCVAGLGTCANAGTWICNAAQTDVECSVQPLPESAELCNGLDDNCEGTVDEGLAAPDCALTTGVCVGAVQTCGGLSGWLPCAGPEYGPTYQVVETTCDGLDNDCDGQADNALTPPSCPLQKGVCAGSFKVCGGTSGWGDCGASEYGSDYEAEETTCDGLDNDCDGLIDEVFEDVGQVCLAGTGACQTAGTYVCNAAGDDVECSAVAGNPTAELCDGIDNNCDGDVDEAFAGLGQICTDGTGGCQVTGVFQCNAAQTDVECSVSAPAGSAETCDGLDNDCDTLVDETWPTLGQVCVVGVGECQASGTNVCNGTQDGVTCSAVEGNSSVEKCDGLDNDCDGAIDEEWPVGQVCVSGLGECQESGTFTCNGNGNGVVCSATPGPSSAEVCDGLDNDCDGEVDESWGALGQVCVVGLGECQATGTNRCNAAGTGLECSATEGSSSPEVCDGLDNDCDGEVDEDWATLGQICEVGIGQCRASGVNLCNASGNGVECSAQEGNPTTELCDGLDNNCDGATDEDWLELGTVCNAGVGECIATGTYTCSSNGSGTVCGAQPGPEGVEVCDSLDNDCDGSTDEDFKNTQGATGYDADTACGNCFTDCTVIYGGLPNAFGRCDVSGSTRTCELTCCFAGIDVNAFPQCPDYDGDGFGDYNYQDADGVPDNGCEFELNPSVIYVSTPANGGSDTSSCGSPAAPCATINYGLQRAQSDASKDRVWVSSGAYYENLSLVEGIDIIGGFNTINWGYAPAVNVTVIYGTTVTPGTPDDRYVIRAENINSVPTEFRGFVVYGEVVPTAGGNSAGIYIRNSDGDLTISDVVIYAGNGGDGISGVDGSNGEDGSNGSVGVAAHTEKSCPDDSVNTQAVDPGGAGGPQQCGLADVSGGAGGRNFCPDWDDNDGGFPDPPYVQTPDPSEAGSNGNGAGGGQGGSMGFDRLTQAQMGGGCVCYLPPDDEPWIGADGENGGDGSGGVGGQGCSNNLGSVFLGRWRGGLGTNGTIGGPGSGGGGGGAAGGVEDLSCNGGMGTHSVGGTGGGGGAGGCGGRQGLGGSGGGGSFGIFVYYTSAPTDAPNISGNTVYTGRGGTGGTGGNGGIGGTGGTGAPGGASGTPGGDDWCAPPGGRGGEGGNGGAGGGGGGGCGGASFGIYVHGEGNTNFNTVKSGNTFTLLGSGGNGGAGGISLVSDGGAGQQGASAATNF